MKIHRFAGPFLVASIFLTGCQIDEEIVNCVEEGAIVIPDITVHATCGDVTSRPVYSWSDSLNDMTAWQVDVAEVATPSDILWKITGDGVPSNIISSPQKHGNEPSGTTTGASTLPALLDLSANVEYIVTVTKADGTTIGSRKFTIKP